ncbi:MAG: hypothetical protein M3280_03395 [Actinomycetota bacterium]|nr:hypothetical protein [Actinomycetota bacterium]
MRPPEKRRRVHLLAVKGNPTEEERRALEATLNRLAESERRARSSSAWLRAARSQGRRLGMYDYRDRFSPADAWRLSARFPAGGREYPGLIGRGDAR